MILERERRGRIEILRLNRPEARNAMSPELSQAIEDALDEIEADPGVGAVILTGTGPVFCAGADLKVVASRRRRRTSRRRRAGSAGSSSVRSSKPLIAAVQGPALAGGFELVLACDLVVAADTATFGLPEAKRGLLAAAGGPIRLAERVPLADRARDRDDRRPDHRGACLRARPGQPGGAGRPGRRRGRRSRRAHHARTRPPRCASPGASCAERRDLDEAGAWALTDRAGRRGHRGRRRHRGLDRLRGEAPPGLERATGERAGGRPACDRGSDHS